MPGSLVGGLCSRGSRLLTALKQATTDARHSHELGQLERPFEIHHSVEFRTPEKIQIQRSCKICPQTILNGRSTLRHFGLSFGPDTYLKEHCYFDSYNGFIEIEGQCAFGQGTFIHGGGGVRIGTNVIVGAYSYLVASNHRFDSPEYPIMLQGDAAIGIRIGRNVWLGCHVGVLDGVTIGDNCVIGAGTLVTRNVASNTVLTNRRTTRERRLYADGIRD